MKEIFDFDEVVKRVSDTMDSLDGEEISEFHNTVHHEKIKYIGDNTWELTGEDDLNANN